MILLFNFNHFVSVPIKVDISRTLYFYFFAFQWLFTVHNKNTRLVPYYEHK